MKRADHPIESLPKRLDATSVVPSAMNTTENSDDNIQDVTPVERCIGYEGTHQCAVNPLMDQGPRKADISRMACRHHNVLLDRE